MSVALTQGRLCEVVSGRSLGEDHNFSFEGVEFDSRNIRGGELFIALKGDQTDGHNFLEQAFHRGASLCLVSDESALESLPEPARGVVVGDTLTAFWDLARFWRREVDAPLVGITGSVGKTTVKELTARMLIKHSRGTYSQKSFNNHTGLPYTLCRINREHKWVVAELGMNHPGEIKQLAEIAEPDAGLITAIAPVHTHVFNSLDQVADAKCELITGLKPGGSILLNCDDEVLLRGVTRVDPGGNVPRKLFGYGDEAISRVHSVTSQGLDGITVDLQLGSERGLVNMKVLGAHNAMNLAAAALAARSVVPDISFEQLKEAAEQFIPPDMRLTLRHISTERRIVDDSYNSNPVAMRALMSLASEVKSNGDRIGFVVGDMLELGEKAQKIHSDISAELATLKPEFVIAVGEFRELFADAAKAVGVRGFVADSPEAAAHLVHKLDCNTIFVKASRGVGLDRTVATVLEVEGETFPGMQEGNA